jgi:hypothetical protein
MNDLQTLQALLAQAPPSHSAVTAGRERLRAEYHRRGKRSRTRTRRIALVAAAASLGTVVAAVTALTPAPSAQAALINAAETTARDSFHVTATVTWSSYTETFTGSFDLRDGISATSGSGGDVRTIGGYTYAWLGNGRWFRLPAPKADGNPGSAPYANPDNGGTDPQQLLRELQSATHVQPDGTASGTGWTGHRYAFNGSITERELVPQPPTGNSHRWGALREVTGHGTNSGTVEIDQDGHVRNITVTTTMHYPGQPVGVSRLVETFSDYGEPVSVSAPPADEIWVNGPTGAYVKLSPSAVPRTSAGG